ncbi:MAG TPA: hypothetical protein VF784_07630 [Anaerolineales bacterium]
MNRALPRILFPLVMLAMILAFILALVPSGTGSAHTKPTSTPRSSALVPGASRLSLSAEAGTPTPTAQAASQPGSTTGIVIMSFTIALIILLPILLQRSLWTR